MGNRQTAILIFSRTAKAESRYKQLANTLSKSRELSTQLIKNSKSTVDATELPYYFISEELQRGDSFGEKISNAFKDIFAKGYKNVIAIGNDCLSLSALDIIYAADVLKKNKAVVGPTLDGGAYLIGMTDISFDSDKFQKIAWQSTETYASLENYFNTLSISPITLDYKTDIDTISDWKIGLRGVDLHLKNRILSILKAKDLFPSKVDFVFINNHIELPSSLRAPPIFH